MSKDKLKNLANQLEKLNLLGLPNELGKNPGVNPHKISIRFGDKTTVLTLQGGKNLPENPMKIDDPKVQRFAQIAALIQKLTSSER